MVLRESQPVNPVTRVTATDIRQSSAGSSVVQPNVRKFAKDPSTADIILDSVVKVASNLGAKAWEAQKEEAYINGVAQASRKNSEQELESNSFMKDWTKAGFRDTKGRLAMAEFQAQRDIAIQEALQSGEDPQEHFSNWLANQNARLTEQLSGMSRQQRAAMFGQLAVDVDAAQKSFTKEYAKYVISQEEASLQASFTAMRANLDTSKDDPTAYAAASRSFVMGVYKDIFLNPKLPAENKLALTKEAIQYAASTDNVQVYEALKSQTFEFLDGTSGTIMEKMPFEDQVELDTVQRQAMERTKNIRAASFEDTIARQMAEWADPNGPGPSIAPEQLDSQLNLALSEGLVSSSRYGTIKKAFYTAQSRNGFDAALGAAYGTGNYSSEVARGRSEEEGLRAWIKLQGDAPPEVVAQRALNVALNTGQTSAAKFAGQLLNPAIAQLGYGQEISPENAQLGHSFIQALEHMEKRSPGAYTHALQSLSEDNQAMVMFMREAQNTQGIADPLTAVEYARQQLIEAKSQGPLRPALVAKATRDDAKFVTEVDDRQLLGTLSKGFKAFVFGSELARNEMLLNPRRQWFEEPDLVAAQRGRVMQEVSSELGILAQTAPTMSSESRQKLAMSRVAARTIETEGGLITVPRGQDIQTFFGAGEFADKEYIGRAINDIVQVEPGNRVEWSLTPGNPQQPSVLIYRKFNEDGGVTETGRLDPKQVGGKVQENLDKDAEEASFKIGDGKVVTRGGSSVQYNGQNTAGFDPGNMLLLRDDIVNSESISNTSYDDGSVVKGNRSFGVGISKTGKHFQEPLGRDGLYTQRQINDSFMRASNDAAEDAAKVMRRMNLEGGDWLRFFGELSYQSPASARDKDMLAYISLGDVDNAVAALQRTNAYKGADERRQQAYINKLKKAMK